MIQCDQVRGGKRRFSVLQRRTLPSVRFEPEAFIRAVPGLRKRLAYGLAPGFSRESLPYEYRVRHGAWKDFSMSQFCRRSKAIGCCPSGVNGASAIALPSGSSVDCLQEFSTTVVELEYT